MDGWWLAAALGLALAVSLWRWQLAHRECAALRSESARTRLALRECQTDLAHTPNAQSLIDATSEALVLVGGDPCQVIALNQAARDLFAPEGNPVGQSLIALTRHHEIDALAQAAQQGSDYLDRQIIIGNRPFRARALPVSYGPTNGEGIHYVALALQDVSELRRLTRARRDMVANVSHELRTPITSIRLLVDTLQGGALRDMEHASQLLEQIAAKTDTLQQMAQELLDLSMIESGRAILRLVPTPVAELVTEAVTRMSEQADRKGQVIAQKGCEKLVALADPEMASRVLTNLLHNAIKFAPEGGHIEIACQAEGEWARISVTDDGPGISFTERERVFERFHRGDRARGGSGTGLGLAIAKHIVEGHSGRIWVAEREVGQRGAQLIFTLPLTNGETSSTDK